MKRRTFLGSMGAAVVAGAAGVFGWSPRRKPAAPAVDEITVECVQESEAVFRREPDGDPLAVWNLSPRFYTYRNGELMCETYQGANGEWFTIGDPKYAYPDGVVKLATEEGGA